MKVFSTLQTFAEKHPWVFGLLGFLVAPVSLHLGLGDSTIVGAAIYRLIWTLAAILLMWPLFGCSYLQHPLKGWHAIMEMGKVIFITAIILFLGTVAEVFLTGSPEVWKTEIWGYALLAVAVGFFEEITCRQGLFMGLKKQFEGMPGGTLRAALIASFAFGALHVIFQLSFTLSGVATALAKTLECAAFSLVLCGILVRSGNFFVPVLMHAVFDFASFSGMAAAPGQELGSYVVADFDGSTLIVLGVHAFEILILIPAMRRAIRVLKEN